MKVKYFSSNLDLQSIGTVFSPSHQWESDDKGDKESLFKEDLTLYRELIRLNALKTVNWLANRSSSWSRDSYDAHELGEWSQSEENPFSNDFNRFHRRTPKLSIRSDDTWRIYQPLIINTSPLNIDSFQANLSHQFGLSCTLSIEHCLSIIIYHRDHSVMMIRQKHVKTDSIIIRKDGDV